VSRDEDDAKALAVLINLRCHMKYRILLIAGLMSIAAGAMAGPPSGWHIYTPSPPHYSSSLSGANIHIGK
jgi:hypothetical protein